MNADSFCETLPKYKFSHVRPMFATGLEMQKGSQIQIDKQHVAGFSNLFLDILDQHIWHKKACFTMSLSQANNFSNKVTQEIALKKISFK